ncbi:MAG TPA: 2-dehydropantoate 2-reductase [Blastocatellia bacterium]|nr:2-dehydropantoate 2-reductase [Blastocatellia bacterium]
MEKPLRYIILGAGAIGSAVGGLLLKAGSRVKMVARPAYAEALARGITIKQEGEETRVTADAVTHARDLSPESGDVLVIATKSQATETAVGELSEVYGTDTPVVCLQNGVRNEEIAARRFDRVYAALVMLSAVQLEPAVIRLPRGRDIALGLYPEGTDALSLRMSEDLKRAGFDSISSAHVMSMKWGKLVANLNNATHAITGYWLERGMAEPDMRELMVAVREEGMRVLDAAGVAYEPPPGEPSPVRIREMTDKLKQAFAPQGDPAARPEESRTYASMWQDLYLRRPSNEARFLNGEIIELGKEVGVATPYNSTLLEIVGRMFEEGAGPGIYTPSDLHALIRARFRGVGP